MYRCSPNIREVESRSSEIVPYYIKSSGLVLQWRRITSKNVNENLHLPPLVRSGAIKGENGCIGSAGFLQRDSVVENYNFLPAGVKLPAAVFLCISAIECLHKLQK